MLAEQLDLRVADALGIAGIDEFHSQVGGQPEAVIDLAKEDRPGVGSHARIGLTQLDGLVKLKFPAPLQRNPLACKGFSSFPGCTY
jgi:hypothetical protein